MSADIIGTRDGWLALSEPAHAAGRLWVDHADRRILIQGELISRARDSRLRHPDVSFAGPPADRVMTIDGVNRRVVYRIREYRHDVFCYVAEWPD